MERELLYTLSKITEEKQILAGEPISKTVYTTSHIFEVASAKRLYENLLVSLRQHTRFALSQSIAKILQKSCMFAKVRLLTFY